MRSPTINATKTVTKRTFSPITGVATDTSPRLSATMVSACPATNSAAITAGCHSGYGPGPARSGSSTTKQPAATTFSTNVDRHTPTAASVARFSDSAAATYSRLLASGSNRCSGRSVTETAGMSGRPIVTQAARAGQV